MAVCLFNIFSFVSLRLPKICACLFVLFLLGFATPSNISTVNAAPGKTTFCSAVLKKISESAYYLLENNGPDEEGRAHPRKQMTIEELEAALEMAYPNGLSPLVKPYHAKRVVGIWTDRNINEVLKRKFDSLLSSKKYEGNLGKLIAEVTTTELFKEPLVEEINGRIFRVSMNGVGASINSSRYKAIQKYLEITKQTEKWKDLRPYHLAVAGPETWDQAARDEVLKKKIGSLLKLKKYKGDLGLLIAQTNQEELSGPLFETINGHSFEVSMSQVVKAFHYSPFKVIQHFIEISGQSESWKDLKPYHLSRAANGTWTQETRDDVLRKQIEHLLKTKYQGSLGNLLAQTNGPELFDTPLTEVINGHRFTISLSEIGNGFGWSLRSAIDRYLKISNQAEAWSGLRDEHLSRAAAGTWDNVTRDAILKDKVESLLKDKYQGNLGRLIAETNQEELLKEPLIEIVGGHPFEISMAQVERSLQSSHFLALKRYFELTGQAEQWTRLRPYHLSIAGPGTWTNDSRDEILKKKIDSLLASTKYDGHLEKLIAETNGFELFGNPLEETVNGYPFQISMGAVGVSIQNSPYLAVKRYLEITGRAKAWGELQPYHLNRAGNGTWSAEIRDDILKRKINSLLSNKYQGDLKRLVSETTQNELFEEPLVEFVNGHPFQVSLSRVGDLIEDSPYLALKRYYQLIKKPFPYSPAVFLGTAETRQRRVAGNLNAYDLRVAAVVEGKIDTSHFGFRQYSAVEKETVRELILEEAINFLGDRNIRYLGLETEQFGLLKLIGNYLNLNAPASTVVEIDSRVANAMRAISSSPRNGLRPLKDLQILQGNIDDTVEELSGPYNLVYLDYMGQMSPGKRQTLGRLLNSPKLLEDKSLIVVTLANRPIDKHRAERGGFGSDQIEALRDAVTSVSPKNMRSEYVGTVNYLGGTDGAQSTPMIAVAFRVSRTGQ